MNLKFLDRFGIASILTLLAYMGLVAAKRPAVVCQTFCCLHSAHAVFFRADADGVCWT
jgi:hypothetical protein